MSDVVIQSEALGKSYFIGHECPREKYTTFRDVIARQARGVWNATRRAWRGQSLVVGDEIEEFWALRDVSFEIKRGEVVGIIGRNGAGKSTLLKILSRITEPTEGRVTLRGRVASLLEVGTGFHPELTGRENMFLNGAILGMTRAEVKRKFDQIVAFAEVEKFLDTPVKRYSSGMHVRLAFSVAAHLEPEILVVDEVLAVGDAEFQKKCLGKMHDVAKGGRTVLFVSHNMTAVGDLCTTAMLLDDGRIVDRGNTKSVIDGYFSRNALKSSPEYVAPSDNTVTRKNGIYLRAAQVLNADGKTTPQLKFGEPFGIRLSWAHEEQKPGIRYNVRLFSARGELYFVANTRSAEHIPLKSRGVRNVVCRFPVNVLVPGHYRLQVSAMLPGAGALYDCPDCLNFEVVEQAYDPTHCYRVTAQPKIAPRYDWQIAASNESTHPTPAEDFATSDR